MQPVLKPVVQRRKSESRHERAHCGAQFRLCPADLRQRDRTAGVSGEEAAPNGIAARHDVVADVELGWPEAKKAWAEAEEPHVDAGRVVEPPNYTSTCTFDL
jgi:hypothetical protein